MEVSPSIRPSGHPAVVSKRSSPFGLGAALACASVVLCALWDRTLAGVLRMVVAGRAVTGAPEGAADCRGRRTGETDRAANCAADCEAAGASAPRPPEEDERRARGAPAWLVLDAAGPQVAAHLGVLDAWRARAACRRFAAFFQQDWLAVARWQSVAAAAGGGELAMVLCDRTARGCPEGIAPAFQQALVDERALEAVDCAGRSPLMQAAHHGAGRLCRALLAARADTATRGSYGWTALHFAATAHPTEACSEVFELLLSHRADLCARCSNGRTPLHYASSAGNESLVARIVAKEEAAEGARLRAARTRALSPRKRGGQDASACDRAYDF